MFGIWPMDLIAGRAAHGSQKLATAVAYKMAALYQESAQHHTAVAQELDNTNRLITRYVMGTDEDANKDPLAAPIEENPQRYYDFPYKMGSETWSNNYPVPGPPSFGVSSMDEYAQDHHPPGGSALEDGPTGFGEITKKGLFDRLLSMGPQSGVDDSLVLLLRSPQLHRDCRRTLPRSASAPSRAPRLHKSRGQKAYRYAGTSVNSNLRRPAAIAGAGKAEESSSSRRGKSIQHIGIEFL